MKAAQEYDRIRAILGERSALRAPSSFGETREDFILRALDNLDARLRVHEPCEGYEPYPAGHFLVGTRPRGPHEYGDDLRCKRCGHAGGEPRYVASKAEPQPARVEKWTLDVWVDHGPLGWARSWQRRSRRTIAAEVVPAGERFSWMATLVEGAPRRGVADTVDAAKDAALVSLAEQGEEQRQRASCPAEHDIS